MEKKSEAAEYEEMKNDEENTSDSSNNKLKSKRSYDYDEENA